MDTKEIRISLGIISDILGILNKGIVDIDKRVSELEAFDTNNDYEYTTIKIPKNASNLDVLMILFNCKVTSQNFGLAHINIDDDTLFNSEWLKTKYKGGVNNETD